MGLKSWITKQALNYVIKQKGIKHFANYDILGNAVHFLGASGQVYIRDGYLKNHHVYSIIQKKIRQATKAEFKLYKINNRKGRKALKSGFEPGKDDAELIEDHDILELIDQPNPSEGKRQFIEGWLGYKQTTGESIVQKIAPSSGRNAGIPRQLYLLPPQLTEIETEQDGITPKKFKLMNGLRERKEVDADDIIFSKYFNPEQENRHRGLAPLRAGLNPLQESNNNAIALLKLLQNVGPPGILTLDDPDATAGQQITDEVKAKLKEEHSGSNNAGDYVVSSYKFTWQQMGMSATDLQLLESDKASLRKLCNIFGVPSYIFNDPEGSTYNNMKEAIKDMINQAIIPELQILVNQFNDHLIPAYEKRDGVKYMIVLDQSVWPEIQEDLQEKVETLSKAWWFSPNEKRKESGLEEIEDDIYNDLWIPTNLIPAGSSQVDPSKALKEAYQRHYENNKR